MYKLYQGAMQQQFVIRLADNAYIPMSEQNSDYQAYLAWIALGNTPLPADEVTQ